MTKDRTLSTAIQILSVLSVYKNTNVTSDLLAKSLRTNSGLVRRVLSKLAKAGLVSTRLGKNGGSSLARPESKISLKDIYDAVYDGPLFGTFDKEPYKPCSVSCQIGDILESTYKGLQDDLRIKMSKVKLKEVVSQIT